MTPLHKEKLALTNLPESGPDRPCPDVLRSIVAQADAARSSGDESGAEVLVDLAFRAYDRCVRRTVLVRLAETADRLGLPRIARDFGLLLDDERTLDLAWAANEARVWLLAPGADLDPGRGEMA